MSEDKNMDESQEGDVPLNPHNIEYKEDSLMTNYEGYWIQKSQLPCVRSRCNKIYNKVNVSKHVVTDEEKQTKLNRMKWNLLRNEQRLLNFAVLKREKLALKTKKRKKLKPERPRKPGKYIGITFKDPDMVKYDTYYVHKKSVAKLDKVKDELAKKGLSTDDYRKALKLEIRKEERSFKREKKREVIEPEPSPRRTFTNQEPSPRRTFTNQEPLPQRNFMQPKPSPQRTLINPELSPHRTFLQPKSYVPPQSYLNVSNAKPKSHLVFDD